MKNLSKIYWEKLYSNDITRYPNYDGWLDKYLPILQNEKKIVDLGCGNGVNALYLHSKNVYVIACDFSEAALHQLKKRLPEISTLCFDMTKGMPFNDAVVDVVIADLSIHYFDWNTTKSIVNEVFRILNKSGLMLCRVNSTKEHRMHDNDKMVEANYYFNGENYKRFFSDKDIQELFFNYNICYICEDTTEKYGDTKHLWEIAIRSK